MEIVSYGAGEADHRWLVRRREGQGAHSRLCSKESTDITRQCGRNGLRAMRAYQQDEKATFASDHRVEDSVLPTFYGEQRVKVLPR